jgi:hypothetical protein
MLHASAAHAAGAAAVYTVILYDSFAEKPSRVTVWMTAGFITIVVFGIVVSAPTSYRAAIAFTSRANELAVGPDGSFWEVNSGC